MKSVEPGTEFVVLLVELVLVPTLISDGLLVEGELLKRRRAGRHAPSRGTALSAA